MPVVPGADGSAARFRTSTWSRRCAALGTRPKRNRLDAAEATSMTRSGTGGARRDRGQGGRCVVHRRLAFPEPRLYEVWRRRGPRRNCRGAVGGSCRRARALRRRATRRAGSAIARRSRRSARGIPRPGAALAARVRATRARRCRATMTELSSVAFRRPPARAWYGARCPASRLACATVTDRLVDAFRHQIRADTELLSVAPASPGSAVRASSRCSVPR